MPKFIRTGAIYDKADKGHRDDIDLAVAVKAAEVTVKVADNYLTDAAAATGGIAVGQLYHNAGAVRVRIS